MGSGHGYGSGGEIPIELPGGSGSGGERPIELIEEGEYPVEIPDDECCAEKTVGGIHYYLVGTGETEVYNCLDNCICHSANPRDVWQYCFKPGRQPVQCNDATVTPSAGHHHPTPDPMMDHEMEGHSMGGHGMGSHEMEGHSMGSHEMEGHSMGPMEGHSMESHEMEGHSMGPMEGHSMESGETEGHSMGPMEGHSMESGEMEG